MERPIEQGRRLSLDRRREQLLALGLEIFAEHPYDRISTDELAERAGVSKGLLYHYFRGKRDYYVCTIREAARRFLAATAPPQGRRLSALRASVGACIAFVEANAGIYQALQRGGLGADPDVSAILEEVRSTTVARLLARLGPVAAPAPTLRTALHGWVGFVETSCLVWLERRDVDKSALADLQIAALVAIVAAIAQMPQPA